MDRIGSGTVSIITPTLDQGRYLPDAINSVATQSMPVLEHIVVDGGSSDETLSILKRSARDGLRWLSEPDDGMYQAINKGLRLAGGEIVGYLNSDDVLLPWATEVVLGAFERHPEWDLVYGDALRYYEELGEFDLVLQAPLRAAVLARTGSFVQPAVFWRRTLMADVGLFDESLKLSADLDYWLRAAKSGVIGQVEEVLAIERVHPGGQTARLNDRLRQEATTVRARHHRDRRSRLGRKVVARLVGEVMVRRQMLRFAAAVRRDRGSWQRTRHQLQPVVRAAWFVHALLTPRPLVGTPVRSTAMRLLRGRWLTFQSGPVLPARHP